MSFAKVIIVGRVGKTPEMFKSKAGDDIAKFSVATSKKSGGSEVTSWHNVICFKKTAENVGKYLAKGSMVAIDGEISYSTYDNKDGVKMYRTDIVANSVQFLTKPATQESIPVEDAETSEIPF
ncbi:MAG: single-stranded DNA-binding protein [Proteobacteria bacterium]|nr:single-stranded DNA-binding protein [Pseudomonadota bacterium]